MNIHRFAPTTPHPFPRPIGRGGCPPGQGEGKFMARVHAQKRLLRDCFQAAPSLAFARSVP